MLKSRLILAALALATLTGVVALQAQDQPGKSPGTDTAKIKDDLRLREQILERQFREFESALLKLIQRLEKSSKLEDREQAGILKKVLESIRDDSISLQFEQIVDFLQKSKFSGLGDLNIVMERTKKLADDMRKILDLMRQDTASLKLRDERLRLEQFIKELEKVIHAQKVVQAQTERGKTDPNDLKGNQHRVTKATADLAKALDKTGQGGEAKNSKGDAKEGGKDGKAGESKDAGKKSESKKGETKEAGDKKGDAKGGEKSPSDKGAKAGAKGGDKKGSESKDGGAKGSKGSEAKPGDSKSGGKGDADSKQGEAKPGSKSDGQGQAKSGGQKGDPQAGDKGDNSAQKPPSGNQPKDDVANGKKKIEEAGYPQVQAEKKIGDKDNKGAADDQGDAIQKLEKAKKDLENLLRQLREEEIERLLAALQARCEKMLAMQIQVLGGTENIFKVVEASADKKPSRQNQQDSIKLSDQEKEIVIEADKAIELLQGEGSAVAFPEVFQQVREDMKHVQRRLEVADTGVVTQAIEKDIIDSLKEMIEALKKAKQEMDNKKSPPPGQPPPGTPPDQKLLDQIAELKMIRSMQLRVNARTETYGKMYVPREGEQTADPNIRRELSNLSERQERIFDITNRIAKGDNK